MSTLIQIDPTVLACLSAVAGVGLYDLTTGLNDGSYDDDCIAGFSSAEIQAALNAADDLDGQPSQPAKPITVWIGISGGCLTGGTTDATEGAVRLIVSDYDQDGVAEAELIDLAGCDEDRRELAKVWEEKLEHNPEAVACVDEKLQEQRMRDEGRCIACGCDLDSPSASGTEDGICAPCIAGDETPEPVPAEEEDQAKSEPECPKCGGLGADPETGIDCSMCFGGGRLSRYTSEDILARYDAGELTDEQTIAELGKRGWAEHRARVILEEHIAE